VLLFSQPGALPAEGLQSVITQARGLDMQQIRKEIAEQEGEQNEAVPQKSTGGG